MSMYWGTLRRRWRLAACIVATAVVTGVVVGALAPKSYDATAQVLIGQRTQVDALLGAADNTPDPERDVNTSVQLITLEPVAETVSRRLGLGLPAADLIGKVETEVEQNSNIVSITVSDASRERAARIANAFALAYRDFRARSARASIEDATASAEERAARFAPGAERKALDAQLRQLQAAAAFQTGGVQIVHSATASSAVASDSLVATAILAGLLGMALAAAVVVLLARTDKRLHDVGDLEAAVGRPVLATVPSSRGRGADVAQRDALATLALSPALRGVGSREGGANGRSARVLLLASPGPLEGTTEVTLGLARALGAMGRRTIAIEADLRAPAFAEKLGLEPGGGLAEALRGTQRLEEELVEIAVSGGGQPVAWALPAGSPVVLPQPLLAGNRMAALVAEARRNADLVLIAGAPAAQFGDSFALVPLADAVLLVARLDLTRLDEALQVVRAVEEQEGRLVGAVATFGRSGRIVRPASATRSLRPRPAPREQWDSTHTSANGSAAASGTSSDVTMR
jgi:polysaccharide biosynthesis transport protein